MIMFSDIYFVLPAKKAMPATINKNFALVIIKNNKVPTASIKTHFVIIQAFSQLLSSVDSNIIFKSPVFIFKV